MVAVVTEEARPKKDTKGKEIMVDFKEKIRIQKEVSKKLSVFCVRLISEHKSLEADLHNLDDNIDGKIRQTKEALDASKATIAQAADNEKRAARAKDVAESRQIDAERALEQFRAENIPLLQKTKEYETKAEMLTKQLQVEERRSREQHEENQAAMKTVSDKLQMTKASHQQVIEPMFFGFLPFISSYLFFFFFKK